LLRTADSLTGRLSRCDHENEAGEEVVDGDGGGKFVEVAGEGSGSVGGGVDYRLCCLAS
jgi:hypothetical protein